MPFGRGVFAAFNSENDGEKRRRTNHENAFAFNRAIVTVLNLIGDRTPIVLLTFPSKDGKSLCIELARRSVRQNIENKMLSFVECTYAKVRVNIYSGSFVLSSSNGSTREP